MSRLLWSPCSTCPASPSRATKAGLTSAAEVPYPDLTEKEVAALDKLYAGHLADNYIEDPQTGYYVGWRILIDKDGRWTAFVAGD
jgi:hypothetical protein